MGIKSCEIYNVWSHFNLKISTKQSVIFVQLQNLNQLCTFYSHYFQIFIFNPGYRSAFWIQIRIQEVISVNIHPNPQHWHIYTFYKKRRWEKTPDNIERAHLIWKAEEGANSGQRRKSTPYMKTGGGCKLRTTLKEHTLYEKRRYSIIVS